MPTYRFSFSAPGSFRPRNPSHGFQWKGRWYWSNRKYLYERRPAQSLSRFRNRRRHDLHIPAKKIYLYSKPILICQKIGYGKFFHISLDPAFRSHNTGKTATGSRKGFHREGSGNIVIEFERCHEMVALIVIASINTSTIIGGSELIENQAVVLVVFTIVIGNIEHIQNCLLCKYIFLAE